MSFEIGTRHAAMCADGKVRRALVINHPDTYFSVPARVKVKGKTVTGYLYHDRDYERDTAESGAGIVRFSANQWMKNGSLLKPKEK